MATKFQSSYPRPRKRTRNARDRERLAPDFDDDSTSLVGDLHIFEGSDGRSRIVVIEQVLYTAPRGNNSHIDSIVLEVKCACAIPGCDWHGRNRIIKISYGSKAQTSEQEEKFIREAKTKAKSSAGDWAIDHLPDIIDSVTKVVSDEGRTVQDPVDSEARLEGNYKVDPEVVRIVVFEKLHPLAELEDLRDVAQVFYDILQIHQWLYECAGVLHCDLSIGNIMFRRKEGKIYGVLNDFDLSSRVQDMNDGPTSNQRTGTRPFMSSDLLNPLWKGGHFYRHDLESLFYIILCFCCRYERPGVPSVEPRAYATWFSGTDDEVLAQKNSFHSNLPKLPIQPYFVDFTQWLRTIRVRINCGYKERPMLRSPEDDLHPLFAPESSNYNWHTLNGNISYSRFREVMSSFQDKPLETRWIGWNPDH